MDLMTLAVNGICLVVGGCIGMLVAALCITSGRGDRAVVAPAQALRDRACDGLGKLDPPETPAAIMTAKYQIKLRSFDDKDAA